MSSPPARSTICGIMRSTLEGSRRSTTSGTACGPSSEHNSFSRSSARSTSTTVAPAASIARAHSRPMPEAAPRDRRHLSTQRIVHDDPPQARPCEDAALARQAVDDHRDGQHAAGDHVAQGRRQVQKRQPVGDRLDDDDPEERRVGRAAPAEEAGAADHGRRDRVEVDVARARLLARRGQPRRGQHAAPALRRPSTA